jgi:hypothetical protein
MMFSQRTAVIWWEIDRELNGLRRARRMVQQTLNPEIQMPALDLDLVENSSFEISGLLNPMILDTPMVEKPQQWDPLDWF